MVDCVAGASGAADGLREAVHRTEQQHELPGAVQHPAACQQPDQVGTWSHSDLSSKSYLSGFWGLLGHECAFLSVNTLPKKKTQRLLWLVPCHCSVLCRFGLLPLSMSNVRKSKATSRSTEAPPKLVSVGVKTCCFKSEAVVSSAHYIVLFRFHFSAPLGVKRCLLYPLPFPAFLNARKTHASPSVWVYICVCVCFGWCINSGLDWCVWVLY